MRYIGIDLHKNSFTVCFFETEDKKSFKTFRLSKLDDFKQNLRKTGVVAVESTTNTRYFVRELES